MVKEKIESVRSLERGFKILECFTEHVTLLTCSIWKKISKKNIL